MVKSLPTRERELKHALPHAMRHAVWSLPTRERELKRAARPQHGLHPGRSLHGSVN